MSKHWRIYAGSAFLLALALFFALRLWLYWERPTPVKWTPPASLSWLEEPTPSEVVPIPSEFYISVTESVAVAEGRPIDIEAENEAASRKIQATRSMWMSLPVPLIMVPGFVPKSAEEPVRLHELAKQRLQKAVSYMNQKGIPFLLVTGGNVAPPGTPMNEAWFMKKALVEEMGVPADQILLEPLAQTTVENLRNAGFIMRAHGMARALVVSSPIHNFYIGWNRWTGLRQRALSEIGHDLGKLSYQGLWSSSFEPSIDEPGR